MSRLPGRHRYLVTPPGHMVAVCFVKTEGRVLTPGRTALDPGLEPGLLSGDLLSLA